MAEYALSFARSARKELQKIDWQIAEKILARIEALAANPRPEGCSKIQGADDIWRIRVGDYRVIYTVDDAKRLINISAVRHRSSAYRSF